MTNLTKFAVRISPPVCRIAMPQFDIYIDQFLESENRKKAWECTMYLLTKRLPGRIEVAIHFSLSTPISLNRSVPPIQQCLEKYLQNSSTIIATHIDRQDFICSVPLRQHLNPELILCTGDRN